MRDYAVCPDTSVQIFRVNTIFQVVMTIVVAFILEMFLFRIAYRRQMHLEDIEGIVESSFTFQQ